MRTLADLRPGDPVWIGDVNGRRRGGEYPARATVEKVGRTLITAGGKQYRKDGGRANDNFGHRWLIPDLEHYRSKLERDRLWVAIRNHYSLPESVTLEDVQKAAALLGVQE